MISKELAALLEKHKIKLLPLNQDLTKISEEDLAITMMDACAVFKECSHCIKELADKAWLRVEYVAKEITRRENIKEGQ